jgi:integrase
MGRTATGWSLVWRERRDADGRRVRKADVRFRHGGKRVQIPTGCSTAAEASRRAGEIYSEYVAGRWERGKVGPVVNTTLGLPDLVADWSDAMTSERDAQTIRRYGVSAGHWVPFFGTVAGFFEEARRADYIRARLKKVLAPTVRYELSSIRGFLDWCKEQRLVSDVPAWPKISSRTIGTRVHSFVTTELSLPEVVAILCELPVLSKLPPHFFVRDRFIVAYETGLRPATLDALTREHYRNGELHITKEIDKNRYDRPLPLTEIARAALERCLPESGLIFGEHEHWRYLKRAAAKVLPAERARTFTAYDFRHMRGTHLAEATGDLPGIAYLFGHLRLTTTNKYMHPSKRAAMRVLSGASKTSDPGLPPADAEREGERNGRIGDVSTSVTERNYYIDSPGYAGAGARAGAHSGATGAEHPGFPAFSASFDAAEWTAFSLSGEVLQ